MLVNGTWLNSGAAVLDSHGRIIESNEEFAFWAGTSQAEPALLLDVLGRKCVAWRPLLEVFLSTPKTFDSKVLRDCNTDPAQWYQAELTSLSGARVFRICRSLPPGEELTEGAWDKFLNEPEPRRELYARALRAEGQLKLLSGKWPGVLFSQRPDFTFSFVSSKIEEWTGIPMEDWARRPQRFWDVVHETDAGELQAQLARCKLGEASTTTFRIRHVKTGRVTYILERREAVLSSNGLVLGYDGAWVDVTRQTIAEKRLASAVWKETLGVLTMGMAHDFSNIMAGIYSLSETYQCSLAEGDELFQGFGLIQRSALQATQLVQRILSLHQGKVGQRNYYSANELLNDTLEVVRKTVRRITVHTECSSEQLPLYVDPIEFRQVLVNLTLNAADAMPDGGDLYFGTALHQEVPPQAHVQGNLPRGPSICIEVRDTGTGIPIEHFNQIFDPFFTTKPLNKGSGLGLYNARLFVEKHSGAITLESVENEGTTFRLWLPKANFTESERFQSELVLGRKTLLVVEMHGKNLEPTAQCLRENGFYVATAESERSAVELLHSPDYHFDAVMALVNGQNRLSPRLFNEIGRLKLPIKKVVQIYGSNQDEHDGALLDCADLVIGADIPPGEIASKLREVLSRLG
ncbi:MAG TPA: ATP-binding protein [Verrucomicrobiae bacterium]|nr:ATP-binding protein [Verrucomicrobiae bacterium]